MDNPLKFIDLFCGIGGFHLALSNLGLKCVFASETDIQTCENYEDNYGIKPAGDITKIDECDIPNHDILAAGFPCQSFSISGKMLGFNDSRGTLFFDVARIAKKHRPKIVLLENVENFSKHDNGRTLSVVKSTMEEIGYSFYSCVLNASHYGIPQARIRTYMVCILGSADYSFPIPTMKKCCVRDIPLPREETKELEINPEKIKIEGEFFAEDCLFEITDDLRHKCILEPVRVGNVKEGRQGERIYADWGHAITFSSHGGGIGAKTGLYLVGGKHGVVRKLHPRECARAMGFPEDFKLHKSRAACWRMFGNSVVVPLIQKIAEKAIQCL